ncbi:MAG: hypothetical protein U0R69_09220 [Gaiellales bacterium]
MTLDGSQSFARVIEEHLELKRRNATLEGSMPIERYRIDDPFQNHPLFKSEEQARLEETLTGSQPSVMSEEMVLAWPAAEETDPSIGTAATAPRPSEDTLWGRSRDFDWGD